MQFFISVGVWPKEEIVISDDSDDEEPSSKPLTLGRARTGDVNLVRTSSCT
jgi:hypothetical protein